MANCLSYDCSDALGDYTPNDCAESLLAGGSGIILLECNHQLTDASSATQINAEIAAGRAKKIDGIKIGINEPSPVQVEANRIGSNQKLVTYDRTGTILDDNVNNTNVDFYNQVFGGRPFGGAIIYLKGSEESSQALVYYIDAAITFTGGLAIKNNNDEIMKFSGTFTWRKKDMPSLPNAPVGIFA
jgi:hypothetical protein